MIAESAFSAHVYWWPSSTATSSERRVNGHRFEVEPDRLAVAVLARRLARAGENVFGYGAARRESGDENRDAQGFSQNDAHH